MLLTKKKLSFAVVPPFLAILFFKAKYQMQLVEWPELKKQLHTAKALSAPENIYKKFNKMGNSFLQGSKLQNPNNLKLKIFKKIIYLK